MRMGDITLVNFPRPEASFFSVYKGEKKGGTEKEREHYRPASNIQTEEFLKERERERGSPSSLHKKWPPGVYNQKREREKVILEKKKKKISE